VLVPPSVRVTDQAEPGGSHGHDRSVQGAAAIASFDYQGAARYHAIRAAVSGSRLEKPISLSYQAATESITPSCTWVRGRSAMGECGSLTMRDEAHSCSNTANTPWRGSRSRRAERVVDLLYGHGAPGDHVELGDAAGAGRDAVSLAGALQVRPDELERPCRTG
jgi:hypothetical protein